jgi:hypothetical protein
MIAKRLSNVESMDNPAGAYSATQAEFSEQSVLVGLLV